MIRTILTAATLVGAVALGSASAQAQSFAATCTNVQYRGSFIVATCLNTVGYPVRTSIDAASCGGGDIINANGRLICGGGGGYRRPPPPPAYGYGGGDDDDYRPRPRRYIPY